MATGAAIGFGGADLNTVENNVESNHPATIRTAITTATNFVCLLNVRSHLEYSYGQSGLIEIFPYLLIHRQYETKLV